MANERMRELWRTGAEGWVKHRALFDAELAPFSEALVAAVGPGPGTRVLDIGCGTGSLLGLMTERGAAGVGVDIAPAMVEEASAQVPAATFVVGDAQTDDLVVHGPFTNITSRFGVMFFEDPVAAFANVRRAAAPAAGLAFVCWRRDEENPMFSLGTSVLLDRLGPGTPLLPPGAPGPTAFADPSLVESILAGAGWSEVAIVPLDANCDYGIDGTDGVEARLTMILNTGAGRLAREQLMPDLGPDGWAALLDEVRDELRANLVDGRVQFNGATWLVTATNPD